MNTILRVVWSNYANFSGRATRREFWVFVLICLILSTGLGLILGPLGVAGSVVMVLWSLTIFVPMLSVTVRRFHDTGRSGWWYLTVFAPFVALVFYFMPLGLYDSHTENVIFWVLMIPSTLVAIVPFVLLVLDTNPETNRWGPNPKDEATYQDGPSTL